MSRRRPIVRVAVASVAVMGIAGCSDAGAVDVADSVSSTEVTEPDVEVDVAESASSTEVTEPDVEVADDVVVADDPIVDIQGHRGARGLRPENTLPGFETALDLGVSTLELDVHLSADSVAIVWHDPVIDPAKCGVDSAASVVPPDPDDPTVDEGALRISSLTASEIAGFRCDRNPDPDRWPEQMAVPGALAGDDYSIPTLDRLLGFVADYAVSDVKTPEQRGAASVVRFHMETKRHPDDPTLVNDGFDGVNAGPLELELLAAIERAGVADRVTISSFDPRSLGALRDADPTIRLAAASRTGVRADLAELVAAGVSAWAPNWRDVDAATLADSHTAGLDVIVWNLNDPAEMERLIELGVDGIITDRPDLALDVG